MSPLCLALAACAPAADATDTADETGEAGETGETGPALQRFEACERSFTVTEANPNYVWTPNAVTLVSEELAPGVFAVYDENAASYAPQGLPLATSAGFVIGDEEVVLIETMINRQLFCQLVDLVRAQTDKPITYAINTSYHGDHSYGNAFLPEEVAVVQHARTADYIAANFEADVAFMEANFGMDQGLDEIIAVAADVRVEDAGWSLSLGAVSVEARYHGFGQTEGDLFVYVPEAEALWTGNPLVAEAPAIPWLLDGHAHEVQGTLAAVRDSLPAGAVVVPGHGRPVDVDGFDFSVGYLGAMIAGVQAALDEGQTVEETSESVTLPEYQGYALWGWVHAMVNVPNTYAELSE